MSNIPESEKEMRSGSTNSSASDVQGAVAGVANYVSSALQNVKDAVVGEVRSSLRVAVCWDMPYAHYDVFRDGRVEYSLYFT